MRWLVVVVVMVACGHPHYDLAVPAPTAAPSERMDAFGRLHAGGRGVLTTCSNRGGCSSEQYLVLADGREIWHPEDLAPVVDPQSPAGDASRRVARAQEGKRFWRNVLLLSLAAGAALSIGAVELHSEPMGYAAVTVLLGGIAVGFGGTLVHAFRLHYATNDLFDHYDEGLAQKLALCANGLALVPCEAPDSPPPPDPVLRSLPQR